MSEVNRYCAEKSNIESCQDNSPQSDDLVMYSDFILIADERDDALAREAVLREELARYKSLFGQAQKAIDRLNEMHFKRMVGLAKRLTAAEKRKAVMEKALTRIAREHDCGCWPCTGSCTSQVALEITVEAMRDIAIAALKPAED